MLKTDVRISAGESADFWDRKTLAEKVVARFRKEIFEGSLEAGTRLIELKLARELDISQATVREAFSVLAAEGLIVRKEYKPTFVRSIDRKTINDAMLVRGELEKLAVAAAGRKIISRINTLEQIANALLIALQQGHMYQSIDLDYQFHRLLVSACDNEALLRCWENTRYEFWVASRERPLNLALECARQIHGEILNELQAGSFRNLSRLVSLDAEDLRQRSESLAEVAKGLLCDTDTHS